MIATGIAPAPERLYERSRLPSPELVYLAAAALKNYRVSHLVTSLAPGWEQALAKAAIELGIPFSIAIPYPGRDLEWEREPRVLYLDLLARAADVIRVCDEYSEAGIMKGHVWRIDRSRLVLALWEFDFQGEIFLALQYALRVGREVANLWNDWQHLYSLRRSRPQVSIQRRNIGAQVFEGKY